MYIYAVRYQHMAQCWRLRDHIVAGHCHPSEKGTQAAHAQQVGQPGLHNMMATVLDAAGFE